MILFSFGTPLLAAPAGQTVPIAVTLAQQPQPTIAPTAAPNATQTSGRRERIEAPPLRPQAAALLIGANIAVAVAIVLFALLLRRRKQRKHGNGS